MHLTQAALAARVGIRTGPLNTLENGHHLPSVPVLYRLADELNVEIGWLLGGEAGRLAAAPQQGAMHEDCVRSERPFSAPAGDYTAVHAQIVRLAPEEQALDAEIIRQLDVVMTVFLALEDICGVQKRAAIPLRFKLPETEAGLDRMTARVRSLLGVGDAVIFDYLELFENAGLRVIFLPLPPGVESLSCYDRDNDNAFFFIATGMTVERQIFRLACELGRIYLLAGRMGERERIGRLDARHAAKRFAALLLMPEEAVVTSVRQTGVAPGDWTWDMLMRLKHRFGVSAESFLYRIEELDLIARPLRDDLKRRIYAYYEANGFAEPDRSRRILSPNGRLGDLLLSAAGRGSSELPALRTTLKAAGVKP